jgi:hypothetical protein
MAATLPLLISSASDKVEYQDTSFDYIPLRGELSVF